MNVLNETERQKLLVELREMGRASSAELESDKKFQLAFYPVAEHLRVFDVNVPLVIGYHGAGKSMLFKAATKPLLSAENIQVIFGKSLFLYMLSPQRAEWLAGYPLSAGGFSDPSTCRQFIRAQSGLHDREEQVLADLWLAYLARVLKKELPGALRPLFDPAGVEIEQIYANLQKDRPQVIKALDELDARLKRDERWIFINYDELDTLGGVDWELMVLLIRGLLTFWADYTRRWQHLQAKIFLRTDLFNDVNIFTADFAKLSGSRVELAWSDRNLYAMVIKRMANLSEDWLVYIRSAGLKVERDDSLGWLPRLPNVESAQPLIEQIVGPFMGGTIKKGQTFTWILDHLRDGNGKITPRVLVNLFGNAAAQELDANRAVGRQLLHPTALRRALDQVSDDYVRMLKSREMPWLEEVARRLSNREVPLARDEWEDIFAQDWQEWREHPQKKQRVPRSTPAAFLDFLMELGVCRQRSDGRIDVPDLFLHGLAIKRRGGVKR